MASKVAKEKEQTSPVLIILLVLTIVGGGVYWFATSPKTPPPPFKNIPIKLQQNVPKQSKTDIQKNEAPNETVGNLNRDPFLPPKFLSQREEVTSNQINVNKEKIQDTLPIWEGLIKTEDQERVLIKYKNKSYLLAENQKIPGTDYVISEINPGSVVLVSPDGQLWLRKKGR